jgi:glycosyltransferase involved in cell wall biosynthesis
VAERLAGPALLGLVADRTGPSLWRVLQPFTALQKAGYRCGWDFQDAHGIGSVAPLFDGYLLSRMAWKPTERRLAEHWFRMIRRAGKVVIYDADDDIFTSTLSFRTVELGWAAGRSFAELEAERFERIWAMQQCDGVTVSTQRLATVVRSYTDKPVIVVPNAIDVPWFRRVLFQYPESGSKEPVDRVRRRQHTTIGWAGGRRPDADLAPMATAWGRIAERFSQVTFVVQGHVAPVITDRVPSERRTILPWMPLEQYPAGLVEIDIGCAAVTDDRFNRCKSAIKAMEYAVAGAAVVATPTIYSQVIEHGRTGYLAETADEWEAALAELVSRPALRAMIARRLLRVVERKCSLRENLWRWPAAWSAIAEDARVRRGRLVAV